MHSRTHTHTENCSNYARDFHRTIIHNDGEQLGCAIIINRVFLYIFSIMVIIMFKICYYNRPVTCFQLNWHIFYVP